ncbi:MAG: M20/M25/M40 family metallo-hydrolase [Desulfobacterales bacterium]|jgi:succinyl-diaminopimelate desuccinylase|nr:M20/M25/M40 family metallo-hydrolase [Desulfobacterales bacterium]
MISAKMADAVLTCVDPDELIRLTGSLVKINSVWDPAAGTSEQAAAEFAAAWAERRGFDVRMETVAPGRPNVIITHAAGPGPRCLMFEGHTDVVTPGDPAAWTYSPFGAEIAGNRMYGRGTNDTKGNLAAMLCAMAALKRSGVPLAGTILGGVLCDEEDQMIGVRHFIEQGHADRVTAAVICEPQDGLICTSQKGALRARFSVRGKMSHGAMPLAGLNTAPAVARIIAGLHALEEAAVSCGRDEHLGWPSFTPTVIQAPAGGPAQLNVIPGEARILADIRTLPRQSHPAIVAELGRLAEAVEDGVRDHYRDYDRRLGIAGRPALDLALEILTDRPCTRTDPSEPVVQAAHWATQRATGRQPLYGGVPGATDGTFLWAWKRIPIVTMGAGDREVPHQADEWVDLGQLVETAKIYALTALHYLGDPAAE